MRNDLVVILAVAFVFLFAGGGSAYYKALQRAETAEESIEAHQAALRSLRRSEAALQDSVTVLELATSGLIEQMEETRARTDTVLVAQLDTITQLVQDTTALRLIAERDSVNAERLASADSVISAQAEEIAARDRLLAARSQVIMNLEAQNEQYEVANSALRDALRSSNRRRWIERGVGVAIVVVALSGALSG